MKFLIIVLLLAAAGAGAYYVLRTKAKPAEPLLSQKEMLAGKWKIDSVDISRSKDSSGMLMVALLLGADSTQRPEYDFHKDGLIINTTGASNDTSHYEWMKENQLSVWETDSIKTKWSVLKLDSLSFTAQSDDSIIYYFKR